MAQLCSHHSALQQAEGAFRGHRRRAALELCSVPPAPPCTAVLGASVLLRVTDTTLPGRSHFPTPTQLLEQPGFGKVLNLAKSSQLRSGRTDTWKQPGSQTPSHTVAYHQMVLLLP